MRIAGAALLLVLAAGFCAATSSRTVQVYEDPRVPSERTIPLHVAVYPAAHPSGDAVFLLSGGAGESSGTPQRFPAQLVLALRATHDLVFVDSRGTGQSNALKCELYPTTVSHFESLYQIDAVKACRAELQRHADLNLYQTWFAADDLDRVRSELGYRKIAIYGDRYGAQVALEYVRRYGKNVTAAILSQIHAPGTELLLTRARAAQSEMTAMFHACESDAACAKRFPDLEAHFAAVLQRFGGGAAEVSVRDPQTGDMTTVRMHRVVFVETLRRLVESSDTFAMVPVVIEEAYRGNFEPIAVAKVRFDGLLQDGMAAGLELSEYCSERVPFVNLTQIQQAARGTFYGDDAFRELQAACAVWNVRAVGAQYLEPVRTRVPVLEIARANDEMLLRLMPHGHELVLDNPLESAQSTCADVIVLDFFANPEAKRDRTLRCNSTPRSIPFALSLPPSLAG